MKNVIFWEPKRSEKLKTDGTHFPLDYVGKIFPATTIRATDGRFINDVFPFPTDVYQSVEVPSGRAIIGIPKRYFMGIGTAKTGKIDFVGIYQSAQSGLNGKNHSHHLRPLLFRQIGHLTLMPIENHPTKAWIIDIGNANHPTKRTLPDKFTAD